jgi:hypothetical protein
MENLRFSTVVGTPIDVYPNVDFDQIGRHYCDLHIMQCGNAYNQLGEKIEVRYTKKELPNGNIRVKIVVDHLK